MNGNWQSEFVAFNGQKIFVKQTGGVDRPAIVLVHGFTDSGRYWSRLAADLATDFNVLMPDMIGHGQSDQIDGGISVADYAESIIVIMDHFGIEQAAIGGHSMGGMIAGAVVAKYGDRFTAVMLEDPAWTIAPTPSPEYLIQYEPVQKWRADNEQMRQMAYEQAMAQVMAENPGWHPDDWTAYLKDRLECDIHIFDQLEWSMRRDWRDHLAQIKVPLLLVTGEAELGGIVGDDFAEMILSLTAQGQLAKISGAGHGIHREQYELFRDAVVPFFEEIK